MGNPSLSIPDELLDDIDAIVEARSSPGDRSNRSAVVRDALRQYVDEHSEEVEAGKAGDDVHVGSASATN